VYTVSTQYELPSPTLELIMFGSAPSAYPAESLKVIHTERPAHASYLT